GGTTRSKGGVDSKNLQYAIVWCSSDKCPSLFGICLPLKRQIHERKVDDWNNSEHDEFDKTTRVPAFHAGKTISEIDYRSRYDRQSDPPRYQRVARKSFRHVRSFVVLAMRAYDRNGTDFRRSLTYCDTSPKYVCGP